MPITHRSIAQSDDGTMRIEELENGRARVTLRLDLDDQGTAEVDEGAFLRTVLEYAEDRGIIPRRRKRPEAEALTLTASSAQKVSHGLLPRA